MSKLGELAAASKAQNAAWFATALQSKAREGGIIIARFKLSVDAVVQASLDNGSTWADVNDGEPYKGGKWQSFQTILDAGELFNLRHTLAAGATVEAKVIE